MHQAADLAVGGALDGFVGWAIQVCAEQVEARDGAIGCVPFGQMAESNGLPKNHLLLFDVFYIFLILSRN